MNADPMVEEFFAEVNDKYYPQVIEGLDMLENGDIDPAIEILARPIHTIKGVSGFMAGFEPASSFTHKVEDFLKGLQSSSIARTPENVDLASRGVTAIFQVLEQIREQGTLDQEEADEILGLLKAAGSASPLERAPSSECVLLVPGEKFQTIRISCPRMHLEEHCAALEKQLERIKDDQNVVLDLEQALSFGSIAWECVAAHAGRLHIAATNMHSACRAVFAAWGFDKHIDLFPSLESYTKALADRLEKREA